MPRPGDKLCLSLQLFDGADDKFVRAYLVDEDRNPVPASPVDLINAGNGLYLDDSVNMPETGFVIAVYRVFKDPAYIIPSPLHSDSADVFILDAGIMDITQKLINLQNDLNTLLSQGITATLTGYIENDTV